MSLVNHLQTCAVDGQERQAANVTQSEIEGNEYQLPALISHRNVGVNQLKQEVNGKMPLLPTTQLNVSASRIDSQHNSRDPKNINTYKNDCMQSAGCQQLAESCLLQNNCLKKNSDKYGGRSSQQIYDSSRKESGYDFNIKRSSSVESHTAHQLHMIQSRNLCTKNKNQAQINQQQEKQNGAHAVRYKRQKIQMKSNEGSMSRAAGKNVKNQDKMLSVGRGSMVVDQERIELQSKNSESTLQILNTNIQNVELQKIFQENKALKQTKKNKVIQNVLLKSLNTYQCQRLQFQPIHSSIFNQTPDRIPTIGGGNKMDTSILGVSQSIDVKRLPNNKQRAAVHPGHTQLDKSPYKQAYLGTKITKRCGQNRYPDRTMKSGSISMSQNKKIINTRADPHNDSKNVNHQSPTKKLFDFTFKDVTGGTHQQRQGQGDHFDQTPECLKGRKLSKDIRADRARDVANNGQQLHLSSKLTSTQDIRSKPQARNKPSHSSKPNAIKIRNSRNAQGSQILASHRNGCSIPASGTQIIESLANPQQLPSETSLMIQSQSQRQDQVRAQNHGQNLSYMDSDWDYRRNGKEDTEKKKQVDHNIFQISNQKVIKHQNQDTCSSPNINKTTAYLDDTLNKAKPCQIVNHFPQKESSQIGDTKHMLSDVHSKCSKCIFDCDDSFLHQSPSSNEFNLPSIDDFSKDQRLETTRVSQGNKMAYESKQSAVMSRNQNIGGNHRPSQKRSTAVEIPIKVNKNKHILDHLTQFTQDITTTSADGGGITLMFYDFNGSKSYLSNRVSNNKRGDRAANPNPRDQQDDGFSPRNHLRHSSTVLQNQKSINSNNIFTNSIKREKIMEVAEALEEHRCKAEQVDHQKREEYNNLQDLNLSSFGNKIQTNQNVSSTVTWFPSPERGLELRTKFVNNVQNSDNMYTPSATNENQMTDHKDRPGQMQRNVQDDHYSYNQNVQINDQQAYQQDREVQQINKNAYKFQTLKPPDSSELLKRIDTLRGKKDGDNGHRIQNYNNGRNSMQQSFISNGFNQMVSNYSGQKLRLEPSVPSTKANQLENQTGEKLDEHTTFEFSKYSENLLNKVNSPCFGANRESTVKQRSESARNQLQSGSSQGQGEQHSAKPKVSKIYSQNSFKDYSNQEWQMVTPATPAEGTESRFISNIKLIENQDENKVSMSRIGESYIQIDGRQDQEKDLESSFNHPASMSPDWNLTMNGTNQNKGQTGSTAINIFAQKRDNNQDDPVKKQDETQI